MMRARLGRLIKRNKHHLLFVPASGSGHVLPRSSFMSVLFVILSFSMTDPKFC